MSRAVIVCCDNGSTGAQSDQDEQLFRWLSLRTATECPSQTDDQTKGREHGLNVITEREGRRSLERDHVVGQN